MRRLVYILALIAYGVFSFRTISLRTSPDLGRHLTDGALILAGHFNEIVRTNYYSYAHPSAPFINHHWLMTIVIYAWAHLFSVAGLNVLYLAIGMLAFALYFREAVKTAGLTTASALVVGFLPLLAARPGVRPEIFSLLFLAIFISVIRNVRRQDFPVSTLWILPAIEILWVNLHPGFILGPVLLGTYIAIDLLTRPFQESRLWLGVLFVTGIAGFANPNGVRGLLFPLTVSGNYAMPVRENLSVFQLQHDGISVLVELTVLILVVGTVLVYRKREKMDLGLLLFSAGLGALSLVFFRVYIFFGYFAFLAICAHLHSLRPPKGGIHRVFLGSIVCIFGIVIIDHLDTVAPRLPVDGFGVASDDGRLAEFLRAEQIEGRIFNGYASGGYLIYNFPERKVFIDSRPEAYPADFIRDDYLKAIDSEEGWQRSLRKYDFEVIVFTQFNEDESRFLLRRFRDPEWPRCSRAISLSW
jgi:hypothetical protein